jgi:hypothetical protein
VDGTVLTRRLLLVYSGAITLVLCVLLLSGSSSEKNASFDEIDVKRINLIEPDGTLRMVIADKAHFPGLIVKGKEYPHDRQTAGMLFFNDEGTENGGLIFGGMKDKAGKVQSWGHLSFDQYMGDQVMVIEAGEENGERRSALQVVDEPDIAMNLITDALQLPSDKREGRLDQLFAGKNQPHQRVYLGRKADRSSSLELKDTEGKARIVMTVAADGTPSLKFLDMQGKIIAQFPKESR